MKIKIKRGASSANHSIDNAVVSQGELVMDTSDNTLYIGTSNTANSTAKVQVGVILKSWTSADIQN